jgi:transposase
MLFCGIDLHLNNCFVVISDDDDRVLYSRCLPNNLDQICAALDPYRTNLFGVVVESTYNWYWLVDGLIDAGYPLHLANTTAIKQCDGLKHRGDESDARHLAHILRLGLLPEGHIMPRATRAVRDLARKRMQLVQQRTTQIVSIETCLAQQTGGCPSTNDVKQLTDTQVDAMLFGAAESMGIKANLAVLQALQTQIDVIEKALSKHCRGNPGYRLLKTVSGIGPILAAVILLETGSIEDLPMLATTPLIAAVLVAPMSPTAKRKAKATQRMVIVIWLGHTSKPLILQFATANRRANSINARKPNATALLPSRR